MGGAKNQNFNKWGEGAKIKTLINVGRRYSVPYQYQWILFLMIFKTGGTLFLKMIDKRMTEQTNGEC